MGWILNVKQTAILIFGWALVLFGIAGTILPIIPGVPLFVAGLIILTRHYAWANRLLARVRVIAAKFKNAWSRCTRRRHPDWSQSGCPGDEI
jgi:uncharacterized membrane protein YbaN (DUF454 family)